MEEKRGLAGTAGKSMAERTPNRHAYKRGRLRHRPLFGLDGGIDPPQSALEGRFAQPSNFTFRLAAGKAWLIGTAAAIYALRRGRGSRGGDPCHPRQRKWGDRERSERWGRAERDGPPPRAASLPPVEPSRGQTAAPGKEPEANSREREKGRGRDRRRERGQKKRPVGMTGRLVVVGRRIELLLRD